MKKSDYEYDEDDYNLDPSLVDWSKPSSDLFWCVWKRNNYKNDNETGATWLFQEENDTLYAIFEETRGRHSQDWNCNLDYYQTPIFSGVFAHEGLLRQFRVFKDELFEKARNKKYIRIAGYSLGGGIAQIAYWYLKTLFPTKDIIGFNFEGPRALWLKNKADRKLFKENFYNIKSHNDIVIHSPAHIMIAPFFRVYVSMFPKFGIRFRWTGKFELSFWRYYGKSVWIGKLWKFIPYPHEPFEILKNLDRKYNTHCSFCIYSLTIQTLAGF